MMGYHSQIIENLCSLYLTNYLELEGRCKIASVSSFCTRQNVPGARAFAPYRRPMTDRNRLCGWLLCLGCTMYEKRTDERTIYRSKSFVRKKYRRNS